MSNWKHAYGWVGHILVSSDETGGNADDNCIPIDPSVFLKLVAAWGDCKLDQRIEIRILGVTSGKTRLLATGVRFSDGFTFYGTVFDAAEEERQPGMPFTDAAVQYTAAMREIYGLNLPPCRLMVGCSSEH